MSTPDPLATAISMNAALMATTDEKEVAALLKREQKGRNRMSFVRRIHSRLNWLRAEREREQLGIPPREVPPPRGFGL